MTRYLLQTLLLLTLLTGCKQDGKSYDEDLIMSAANPVSVDGTRFIDSYGRQVILSGVNKVNKNPGMNYTDPDSLGSYEQLTRWGFNCIRLGIIWDGMEPEPGKYDEKYLDRIEERINWASQHGLYVLLDMHQDLYSVLFSDGAPSWATLTDNKPHETGDIWSDAYFMSEAVQKAFDNFWANTPASDGVGLQDHYASMWKHIAHRFAGNKTVLGYDIMNEPFNGSQGTYILPLILTEYARLHAEETGKILSQNEIMEIWADEDMRFEALKRMEDPAKYSRVLDKATELNQLFEKTTLQPMYQKVGDAIREVDTTHILFLEHAYFGNTGIRSGIEAVTGKDGKRDPLVAYAAHGYDLLVDTKNYESQSNDRVELLFSRVNETSQRMNAPVLVGEWGAFHSDSEKTTLAAQFIINLFEKFGFSNTYWAYYNGIEKHPYFNNALVRPYPPYTAGRLVNYSHNFDTGLFTATWEELRDISAPTVIYIPDMEDLVMESISLNPERSNTVIQAIQGSRAGYLIIPPTGDSLTRTIGFRINKNETSYSIEGKTNK